MDDGNTTVGNLALTCSFWGLKFVQVLMFLFNIHFIARKVSGSIQI
jgi:hypothetical protein